MSSGNSFYAEYRFSADNLHKAEVEAEKIAVEQTAELPPDTVPEKLKRYIGNVSDLTQVNESRWQAKINYQKELVSDDPVQFLNVLFGNISIQPGVQITDLDREHLKELLPGPAFGINGIRSILNAGKRPLSCTALKPTGSSPSELAKMAASFTEGGIDIIKDDHGLANQPAADYQSRVKQCIDAIRAGEQKSGKKTLYFPNITGPSSDLFKKIKIAQDLGADGLLVSPQLTGLNTLEEIVRSGTDLPVMAHPAFSGPYTIHKNSGFKPSIYFGLLWRALGADCIIYPNAGGRFSYTLQECLDINSECRSPKLDLPESFPVPAGGINRNSLKDWMKDYGRDTIFLIGGSLYQHPEGLKSAAKEFQKTLESYE